MSVYYVSPYGSSSGNGLSPDPTNPTNKPFLTIAQAVGGAAAAPGDTVYIAPGVYRAPINVVCNGTSGAWITVSGDPGNTQGFKDGSGNLLTAGEVRCTNFTPNDTTAPTNPTTLALYTRSYLAFSNLWIIGGTSGSGVAIAVDYGSHDITFNSCMFTQGAATNSGQLSFSLTNTTGQLALNMTFDRCVFIPNGSNGLTAILTRTAAGTADYSAGITIQNSLFLGGATQLRVMSAGNGTFMGGGVAVKNCTFLFSSNSSIATTDAGISATTAPITVSNCLVLPSGAVAVAANTAGQIVEDYNILTTGRNNVGVGTHSKSDSSICPQLDFGQWMLWGQSPRAFGTPTAGSPLLGFGSTAAGPAYDWMGRSRPEGGGALTPSAGYLERHDTAVQDNIVVDSGTSSIRIDGPGSHEFQIPVDAIATTISVKCQYDVNHGTATPPQAILVAAPELGVVAQTLTAAATTGAWLTLTFATITPTARGVVRVQLAARPAAVNGKAYFDTFAVA